MTLAAAAVPLTAAPDGPAPAPLEAWVEAEPLPALDDLDAGRLVTLATELVRRLRDVGVAAARDALAAAFPFAAEAPGARVRPFAGRVPDPRALRAALVPELDERG